MFGLCLWPGLWSDAAQELISSFDISSWGPWGGAVCHWQSPGVPQTPMETLLKGVVYETTAGREAEKY